MMFRAFGTYNTSGMIKLSISNIPTLTILILYFKVLIALLILVTGVNKFKLPTM